MFRGMVEMCTREELLDKSAHNDHVSEPLTHGSFSRFLLASFQTFPSLKQLKVCSSPL